MKGPMTLKHRKNIVRDAKRLINSEVEDYDTKPSGEQETILDHYIGIVCDQKGWDLSHFYFEEGKVLEKILR